MQTARTRQFHNQLVRKGGSGKKRAGEILAKHGGKFESQIQSPGREGGVSRFNAPNPTAAKLPVLAAAGRAATVRERLPPQRDRPLGSDAPSVLAAALLQRKDPRQLNGKLEKVQRRGMLFNIVVAEDDFRRPAEVRPFVEDLE